MLLLQLKLVKEWENCVNEAPTLVRRRSEYILLHSSASTFDKTYGISIASSDNVLGPYVKANGLFLTTQATDGTVLGPRIYLSRFVSCLQEVDVLCQSLKMER